MTSGSSSAILARLSRARADLHRAPIDALAVTHLSNVRYLTGFSATAGIVVLTPTECTLIVDFRYAVAARAHLGAHPDLGARIRIVVPDHSYDETLATVLTETGARRIGIEAAWMPVNRFNKLSAALAAAAMPAMLSTNGCPVLVPTERLIERARAVKDGEEIATLREAARRIAAVAAEVPAFAQPGSSEVDVASAVDAAIRRAGFERTAFETIVASGPNSALPHARPGSRRLQQGDGVVLDFGGVYDGYCVDLTRTVQLGDPGAQFRWLFAAVEEAQRAAIDSVRPGVTASAVDAAARAVLDRYGVLENFGHGTGHGLGLEVHEEPRIGRPVAGWPDEPLEAGMVFTVEPGAYVEGVGGVRIEDDVLVTEGGCEVLTARLR
jgi:Xaa-Pro aminopeptidase